jgi:hypothetical protein
MNIFNREKGTVVRTAKLTVYIEEEVAADGTLSYNVEFDIGKVDKFISHGVSVPLVAVAKAFELASEDLDTQVQIDKLFTE